MTGEESRHEPFPRLRGKVPAGRMRGFRRGSLAAKSALTWPSAFLSRKRERSAGIVGKESWHDGSGVFALAVPPLAGEGARRADEGPLRAYSTVTDLARLRGLSTSVPRARAV